jgi:hypothetical protein
MQKNPSILGLYFSNLTETARGMVENFAHILRFHGFIPNSGNIQWVFWQFNLILAFSFEDCLDEANLPFSPK